MGTSTFDGPDRARRRELKAAARHLDRRGAPGADRFAAALARAAKARPDAEATRWFARIEEQRRRLLADDRELSGGRGTTSTVGSV